MYEVYLCCAWQDTFIRSFDSYEEARNFAEEMEREEGGTYTVREA